MSKQWFKRKKSVRGDGTEKFLNNPDVCCIENLPTHGYSGFLRYFPDQSFQVVSSKQHVAAVQQYLNDHKSTFTFSEIIKDGYFLLDYRSMSSDEELFRQWPDFKDDLANNFEYCFNCIALAMHQVIIQHYERHEEDLDDNELDKMVIYPRVINWEPVLQLKDIRVNCYGKLVTIRGTAIRASHVKVLHKHLAFSCATCKGTQLVKQVDGKYLTLPKKCPTKGCRAQSNFHKMHSSDFSMIMYWQSLKIQEVLGTEKYENGRMPRTLECEFTQDLVNSCIPGDDVTVTGVIKARDSKGNQHTMFNLYLEAFSVWNSAKENKSGRNSTDAITFDKNDYNLINKICSTPNLFKLLVQSLCPNIYGHEIVKAGLLLALFGGTKSDMYRAESHILMVGDPGLGKSQMLQACSNVAPRGIYVCGNTSTNSGLTVTVKKEGNEFSLEAGALTLADRGCCCIDEFDKMPSQHACLLEAMEQQCISIAKAGVICNIPTRATILAAANPVGGHYDKSKTIAENLKMSSPMLSRFDLIFILLDQADERLDGLLSKHILGLHAGARDRSTSDLSSSSVETTHLTLRDRLRSNGEQSDHLPHSLFRKYIAYAQKYVKPSLSLEAKAIIKDFYISLRRQFQTGDSTPVTPRQLDSLIRLTEARAKLELREEATKEDASDVIEIVKFSMVDIFTDSCGILDKTRSQNVTTTSSKNQTIKLLKVLQRRSDAETKSLFTLTEIRALGDQIGISKDKVYSIIQGLNLQGYLLNKGLGKYQLVTADIE